jgi:glutamate dehydrogenase/leucine dehydrogenase
MTQNSMRLSWTREEVDTRLQMIMKSIHQTCLDAAEQYGTPGNYVNGANIAGFVKVVDAMIDQGRSVPHVKRKGGTPVHPGPISELILHPTG